MKKILLATLTLTNIAIFAIHPTLEKAQILADNPNQRTEFLNALMEADENSASFTPNDHDLYEKLINKAFDQSEEVQPLKEREDSFATQIANDAKAFRQKENQKKDAEIKQAQRERPEYARFTENLKDSLSETNATDEEKEQAFRKNAHAAINASDTELQQQNDEYEQEIQNLEQIHHNKALQEDESDDENEDHDA